MQQPGGGSVDVLADGVSVGSVDTAGDQTTNGAATLPLPAGNEAGGTAGLRRAGAGLRSGVRDTGNKGITYDSIGLNGASTTVMSRAFSQENWSQALEHRDPDLVVINYGTNESSFPAYVEKQYEPELRTAIAKVRAALPETSILVMSPMDRGAREGDAISTMPAIPRLVEIQQRVAAETGLRFLQHLRRHGRQWDHGALVRRASPNGRRRPDPSHAAGRADRGPVAHRAAADRLREVSAASSTANAASRK